MPIETHLRHDKIAAWLAAPLAPDLAERIERMAEAEGVVKIAVMPDAHIAAAYCVGTVVATKSQIYPHAIGGDIGCGLAAVRIHCAVERIEREQGARQLLRALRDCVPTIRHSKASACQQLPPELATWTLSDPGLEKLKSREGRSQLGTLGRGNHFLEFQSDEDDHPWLMVHSGSRAMGQAITAHHLAHAPLPAPLPFFLDSSEAGKAYLHDVAWAREYARHNRRAMLSIVAEVLETLWRIQVDFDSLIECDHNHVRQESHAGQSLWIHRKGAQSAAIGEPGIIPGSMGTTSYHVEGRGLEEALCSSSHGAGRLYSRGEARGKISAKDLLRQMRDVRFDERNARQLVDEAPSVYRDIRKVMRAQRELVKTVRTLRPVLNHKGM